MQRFITCAAVVVWLATPETFLAAQEAKPENKPIEGTLTIGKRVYKLAHAVAYETKHGDETYIAVLASDRKIPFNEIEAALKKNDGSDEQLSLDQLNVVITFNKSGDPSGATRRATAARFPVRANCRAAR